MSYSSIKPHYNGLGEYGVATPLRHDRIKTDFPVIDPLHEEEEEYSVRDTEEEEVVVVDKHDINTLLRETQDVNATTGKVLAEYYQSYKNYSPRYY